MSYRVRFLSSVGAMLLAAGFASAQGQEGKPLTLKAGRFAMLPSRHVHEFHCATPCSLYVHSDAAFDIHYVDDQGKEISPADAMKAVHQTAATEMKAIS